MKPRQVPSGKQPRSRSSNTVGRSDRWRHNNMLDDQMLDDHIGPSYLDDQVPLANLLKNQSLRDSRCEPKSNLAMLRQALPPESATCSNLLESPAQWRSRCLEGRGSVPQAAGNLHSSVVFAARRSGRRKLPRNRIAVRQPKASHSRQSYQPSPTPRRRLRKTKWKTTACEIWHYRREHSLQIAFLGKSEGNTRHPKKFRAQIAVYRDQRSQRNKPRPAIAHSNARHLCERTVASGGWSEHSDHHPLHEHVNHCAGDERRKQGESCVPRGIFRLAHGRQRRFKSAIGEDQEHHGLHPNVRRNRCCRAPWGRMKDRKRSASQDHHQ